MKPLILLLSDPSDTHAHAVIEALHRRGVDAVFWNTSDFPSRDTESIVFDGRSRRLLSSREGHGLPWRDEETSWAAYTALLDVGRLVDDEILRLTPGIYQELVPKEYELRATVMGDRALTARVFSQQTSAGRLDWRKAYGELRMERADLPPDIESLCLRLCRRLGLAFGCIDLIVTPDGDNVFLEVNEAGQFLFIEEFTGLPLLDAFCEFLIQGQPNFSWSEAGVRIRYNEVEDAARRAAETASALHVVPPDSTISESRPSSQEALR